MPQPSTLKVLNGLVAILLTVTTERGYNFTFTESSVGINPFSFDAQDNTIDFPQVVVRELISDITDSNASVFLDAPQFEVSGFLPSNTKAVITQAVLLRDDITVALMRATKEFFKDTDGTVFVNSYAVKGQREIATGDQTLPGCVEVRVRVSITYKQKV